METQIAYSTLLYSAKFNRKVAILISTQLSTFVLGTSFLIF